MRTDCKFSGEKIVVGAVSFRQNKNRESGPTPSLSIHLDTNVGERGIKLSGGEKQRLAFARAIFQNKKVLILDEPAPALDNITESSIMSMLLETCKDKTLIIVAHRLNFIKHVDKILVVKNGKIASQGDFAHLFEHCDDFRELWRKQNSHHELGLQGKAETERQLKPKKEANHGHTKWYGMGTPQQDPLRWNGRTV